MFGNFDEVDNVEIHEDELSDPISMWNYEDTFLQILKFVHEHPTPFGV